MNRTPKTPGSGRRGRRPARDRRSGAGTDPRWKEEVVEAVASAEGTSEAWAVAARQGLDKVMASEVLTSDATEVGNLLMGLLRELTSQNANWNLALCRAIWRDAQAEEDGVRVPMARYVIDLPDAPSESSPARRQQGSDQGDALATELSRFADNQGVDDVITLTEYTWAELRGVAASEGLSLRARSWLQSSCRRNHEQAETEGLQGVASSLLKPTKAGATPYKPPDKPPVRPRQDQPEQGSEAEKVASLRKRLQFKQLRPQDAFSHALEDFRPQPDWPWAGTARASRSAPEFLATIYGAGHLAKTHAEEFLRPRGLLDTPEGSEMVLCGAVLDQLFLFDQQSILNSAGVEILVRRMKGIELSLDRVTSRDKLSKKSDELAWIDLVQFTDRDRDLDEEIRSQKKQAALLLKHQVAPPGGAGL